MARNKSGKLNAWQKLLTVMISGKEISIDEIDKTLGKEIYMYRLSTYMWDIKNYANGVIKAVKDGRKVVAYQLINVTEMKEFMNRTGLSGSNFTPGQDVKKSSVSKLADLAAKPAPAKKAPAKKTPAKPKKVEAQVVTGDADLEIEEIQDAA